ncbi:DUF1579 family protein [bacterium]|nr:DUF1579 family protein [bacterium]
MKYLYTYAVMLLVLSTPLFAQDATQTDPPLDQTRLNLFVGNWEGPGSYEGGDGQKITFTMTMSGKHILDDKAVELNPFAELGEMGHYMEKDIVAYDPMTKKMSLLCVSNMGEVAKYDGTWVEGSKNTLRFKGQKIVGNSTYKTEQTIFFHDGDKVTWRALTTKDGKADGTFECTMTKK